MEQVGHDLVQNVQDYIVNIDLTKTQFDADKLFEEASRLGMDFGDLQEYGFHVGSDKCGGKTCINKDSFRDFADALSKKNNFTKKTMDEMANFYKKAQCHP